MGKRKGMTEQAPPASVNPNLEAESLAVDAWVLRHENRTRSRELAQQALESDPDPRTRGMALRALAYCDYIDSAYEAALEGFTSALDMARGERDQSLERDCLNFLGAVHQRLGNVDAAIEYTRQAFQINLALQDEPAVIYSLNNFGMLHREIGEDKEAVRLFEDALERARHINDATRQVTVIANLGEILPRLNRAEEAVALLREGLHIAESHNLEMLEAPLMTNLADALAHLERFEEALEVYAQALEVIRDDGPPEGEIHCQLGMARINLHRQRPEAALQDAERVLEMSERLGLYEASSQAHSLLSEIHKSLNDYPSALHHLERHHELERRRREELAERRLRAVNAQFEVRRAEAEIERLRNVELARALERLEQLDREKTELLRELQRKSRELEALAFKDSLTGLPNRRHLESVLRKEFVKAQTKTLPLPVAVLDVDDFKRINDEFSHEIGDAVLVQIAEILTSGLRAFDLAARYGGEEFVLMLPRTSSDQARAVCERLRLAVESHDWHGIHPALNVTISVGLSSDSSANSADRLLNAADTKLYEAKRQGKNRVCD
jgi:diguanylate cyclase (GGDEF)-like protein